MILNSRLQRVTWYAPYPIYPCDAFFIFAIVLNAEDASELIWVNNFETTTKLKVFCRVFQPTRPMNEGVKETVGINQFL